MNKTIDTDELNRLLNKLLESKNNHVQKLNLGYNAF